MVYAAIILQLFTKQTEGIPVLHECIYVYISTILKYTGICGAHIQLCVRNVSCTGQASSHRHYGTHSIIAEPVTMTLIRLLTHPMNTPELYKKYIAWMNYELLTKLNEKSPQLYTDYVLVWVDSTRVSHLSCRGLDVRSFPWSSSSWMLFTAHLPVVSRV